MKKYGNNSIHQHSLEDNKKLTEAYEKDQNLPFPIDDVQTKKIIQGLPIRVSVDGNEKILFSEIKKIPISINQNHSLFKDLKVETVPIDKNGHPLKPSNGLKYWRNVRKERWLKVNGNRGKKKTI